MSIIETSTRRRVTIFMATITAILFGFIALTELKVTLLPDLSYPTLTVRTEYTGAAPAEIENLITEPVEEALGVVKNVRRIRSVSRASQSDVTLEFVWGTNMDMAALEVREKLELIQLPLDVRKPTLLRFDPSTQPVLRYGLVGSGPVDVFNEAELKQLRRFADEQLKKRIEPVAGVAAVKIGGGLEDEIQVEIDQQKLKQLNIDVGFVIDRLRVENVNISGGRLDEGSQRFLVRTINQFADVDEIANMLLLPNSTATIRLKDVATVRQGYKERESIIRIDGREAVELAVYKEGDANTVAVAEDVNALIKRLDDNKAFPTGTTVHHIDDQSRFIKSSLDEVKSNAFWGGLLSILVIFLYLRNVRATIVIGVSLPVSIITTFFFMDLFGLSLNIMSLGGLALATGMVVDAAIVVLENIQRLRDEGKGVMEATIKGTQEVGMAVTASVLTSVAVFLPLVFVEGVAGQMFKDQALTVSISLLVSLVVSLTLIPMLASLEDITFRTDADGEPQSDAHSGREGRSLRGVRWVVERVNTLARWAFFQTARLVIHLVKFLGWLLGIPLKPAANWVMEMQVKQESVYARFLPWAIRHPVKVLGVAFGFFVMALALLPGLGLDLVPQLAQGQFEATLKLPPGTPLAETDAIVRAMETTKDDRIKSIYGVSGSGTRLDANPTESGENIARLLVSLPPGAGRAQEEAAMDLLRDKARSLGISDATFARPALLNFTTPLEIEIASFDLDRLQRAGQLVSAALAKNNRFADVKSTVEAGQPEIQIHFDQERAAALGLSTRQIADQVVRQVRGEVATRHSFGDRKIDVLVRARPTDRASVEDIKNLIVNPGSERPVTLTAVADVVATEGPGEIRRSDQERVALVSSNLAYGDLGTAADIAKGIIDGIDLPAGVSYRVSGQSEELKASMNSMIFALALAVFLVYLVMASQFESLMHPFVILFSIPMAIIGCVFGLKLFGMPLSVIAGIGIIMLAGIVVNNAIVLLDRVNQLRGEGVAKLDALVEGSKSRLRAIAMTTVTTLVGFIPLAMGLGDGAEIRQPMAITVIAGLTVSTLLTLIVIPVMYSLMDRKPDSYYVERARREAEALRTESAAAAASH